MALLQRVTQGSKPWSFGRNLGQQCVSNFGEQNNRVETDTPPEILVHLGGGEVEPRICIWNISPGDADAAGPWTEL